MTTVLVCGGDSWANRGDDAILAGTLAGLRALQGDLHIMAASGDPALTERRHGIAAVDRRRPREMAGAIRSADVMLWGGGRLLQNESSRPFLWAQLGLLEMAFWSGVPVLGFAQGIGAVRGAPDRLLAARALARIPRFTVRDARSAAALCELGMPADRIEITGDPALLVTPASPERAAAIAHALGLPTRFVAVALRRWGHYRGGLLPVRLSRRLPASTEQLRWESNFREGMATALDCFWIAEAVRQRMRHASRATLLRADLSAAELAAVLGRAEMAVGLRMHPLILAALSGVPLVSLSYQGKGRAFLERLGLERFALDIEQFNEDVLVRLLEMAWDERAAIRAQIGSALPALQAGALRNFALVREMLGAGGVEEDGPLSPGPFPPILGARGDGRGTAAATGLFVPRPPSGSLPSRIGGRAGEGGRSPAAPLFDAHEAAAWASLTTARPAWRSALLPRLLATAIRHRADRCIALAAPRAGETALDLGCGPGDTAARLAAAGVRVVGMDRSAAMLALAHREAEPRWARADATALPLRDGCLDLAICAGVLEYLPTVALEAALAELRRTLRPGGRLVISLTERHPLRVLRTALPGWVPRPLRALGPVYDHLPGATVRLAAFGFRTVESERFRTPPLGVATVVLLARREG
ncbi:MAG: polysaccharide pyruvyl transferase family protein [Chloroflexi bacterium]|nr:polysaccharide pyruvyl transferase family protein [Chloroflexota bacterium]